MGRQLKLVIHSNKDKMKICFNSMINPTFSAPPLTSLTSFFFFFLDCQHSKSNHIIGLTATLYNFLFNVIDKAILGSTLKKYLQFTNIKIIK